MKVYKGNAQDMIFRRCLSYIYRAKGNKRKALEMAKEDLSGYRNYAYIYALLLDLYSRVIEGIDKK